MRAFLLFRIIFFAGTCCILADSGEIRGSGTNIIENSLPTVDDEESFDYDDADHDTEAFQRSLFNNHTKLHKKKIIFPTRTPLQKILEETIKKIKKEENEKRQYSIVKLIFKIVGGVILLLIFGGLYAFAKRLCKPNRQTITSNPEETVPSLSPMSNTTQTQMYLQQPAAYPLMQMPNPSTGYYSPLQQNAPYPNAPYRTIPYSTGPALNPPAPNVQEKEANNHV